MPPMSRRAFAGLTFGALSLPKFRAESRAVRLVTKGPTPKTWQQYANRTAVFDATTGENLSARIPWEYAKEFMGGADLVHVDAFVKPIRVNPSSGDIEREPMLLRVVERRTEP